MSSSIEDRPQPEQRRVDAAAQDVEDVLDPGLAVGGQAPQVGAPDQHRPGAERERLDDVGAAPDAAVEERPRPGRRPRRRSACSIRIAAGVPSRLLPPWLDTEIAVTPASTARLASSTRHTPLSMNGPAPLLLRIHATSSQDGGGVVIHS